MASGKEHISTYVKDFNAPAKERNFFILMDGTWNDETGKDGDGLVTNIVNLYRSLAADSDRQITRYFRGVGNDEENSMFGIVRGGAFGANEKRIRDDAYSTIAKEYRNGDRLFILGFSRGAASARLLASQINKEGIPEKISIATKPRSNKFTNHIEHRFVKYETEGGKKDIDIEFLGVWDTVYAFGIPMSIGPLKFREWNLFKDRTVSSSVKRAVHLLGLDETRKPFIPTLMNYDPARVEEVWFAGVHADVGGGYAESELAKITLAYMVDRIHKLVSEKGFNQIEYKPDFISRFTQLNDPKFRFHFHGLGFKRSIRDVYVQENDQVSDKPPKIHQSVFDIQDSSETYSVVERKKGFMRGKEVREIPIVYNPPNLRPLRGNININQ